MTSPVLTARDTIVTIVEALTPPSDPERTYHHWLAMDDPKDVSGHRAFEIHAVASTTTFEQAADYSQARNDLMMVVYYSTAHLRNVRDATDLFFDEVALLRNAINHYSTTFGTGVGPVTAHRATWADSDSMDLEIRLEIQIESEESD